MPRKRLNPAARRVVDLANEIAHEYELEYVGTEHVLLAILRAGPNTGAQALHNLGVDEVTLREKVDQLVQRDKEDTWVFGRLPGSPHYRSVIERAMDIAEQLEAAEIGAEHLLLALYQDEESTAQRALVGVGISARRCRDEILRVLSQD